MRVILSAALAACVVGGVLGLAGSAAFADGYKNCTKLDKASWKPASEAEAKAKALGYEVRRSKVEGSCYEVYGVKEGKLYELFYSPEDLSLKHTIAK
nr:PepSY domain-containing protein [Bradyrhizobium sp. Ce-3]